MNLVVTLYLWTVVASNGVAGSSNSVLHDLKILYKLKH